MGHRDEAVAEGLEVTPLQALLFFQSLAARPVKALQAEGAGGRESGRRNDTTQHITAREEKTRGFCTTFDMSYKSRSSTRELTLHHAMLAVLTLDSHC